MTDFLDRMNRLMNAEKAWVLIITGSGAHSPYGPVLRGAVEALLVKRKIEYYPMKGKGSFLVNASSGFVLYEPAQPRDSKVIVAPSSASNSAYDRSYGGIGVSKKNKHAIRPVTLTQKVSDSDTGDSRKALKNSFHKRCKEETAFEKALSESLEETKKAKEDDENDEELLERAFNLSLLDKQKEKEEEQKLHEAMEISRRESLVQAMDEEEQIRKVAALSKMEFDFQNDPDACLLRAIELSRKECNEIDDEMLMVLEESVLKYQHHQQDQEDDEEFLKTLEQSVAEF